MHRLLTVILLAALIPGCASITIEEPAPQDLRPLQVFYATDREPEISGPGGVDYGSRRGRQIHYGIATVNAWPIEYEEQGADGEIRKLITRPIATGFARADSLRRERFFRQLRDPERAGKPGRILLFVHGFKRNFRAAAEHVALISEAIGFDGRAVFWTWPSLDSATGYLTDRTTLMWSQKQLAQFITELVQLGETKELVLLAHSLGTEGLTQALFREIGAERLARWDVIERLVLLAPDIDLGMFRRDIVPAINRVGIPTTVYASSTDYALITSSKVNGYPRAGDSSEEVFTFPGIDTIDATQVTQSFLGHSYYRRSFAVIDDLHLMIVKNVPANERPGLERRRVKGGVYWNLK